MAKPLTPKQKQFCEEYVRCNNGTKAAILAGYSEESANVQASQNLTKTNILDYVKELQADLSKITGITRLYTLEKLNVLAMESEKESDRINALDKINKMLGYNEPEKFNLSGGLDSTIVTPKEVKDISEQLQKDV